MTKESRTLLDWRSKQRRGAIMKPETFQRIHDEAIKRHLSETRANAIAGRAYWRTAESKYRKAH